MTLLDDARSLGPVLRSYSDEAESLRRLPSEVVRLLAEGGFFKLGLPERYGGAELDPVTFVEVIDELGRHDAAAAWCSMIASTTAPMAAYLPEADADEIYGGDPLTVTGGALAPSGVGRSTEGGFVVSGRWQWGSGTQHCQWICAGTIIDENDFRLVFFPAAEVDILDTWHSSGLRGTGSTDFTVTDLFAPEGRAVPIGSGQPPRLDRPLYRFPLFSLLSIAVASVCLGIARRAIDEIVELAEAKTPAFASRRLAKSTMAQVDVAKAEAALGVGACVLARRGRHDVGRCPRGERHHNRAASAHPSRGHERRRALRRGGRPRVQHRRRFVGLFVEPAAAVLPRHPHRDAAPDGVAPRL